MICKGHNIKEAQLNSYFRLLGFVVFNTSVDKRHRVKKPSDLWGIPVLDEPEKQREETEAQQQANYKNFLQIDQFFRRIDAKKKHKNG